ADELFDRTAVQLDQAPAGAEVPREKLARLFGIAFLRSRGEADEVSEEDGDEATFGHRLRGCRLRRRRRRGGRLVESRATLVAKSHRCVVRRTARGARARKRSTAGTTEARARGVLDAAAGALGHRQSVERADRQRQV